jgi:DNA methylase
VQNVLLHGTGAINIGACRVEGSKRHPGNYTDKRSEAEVYGKYADSDRSGFDASQGRWPANVIHDGSEEVVAAFPQSDIGGGLRDAVQTAGSVWGIGGDRSSVPGGPTYGDSGSAARFFYTAKADADDRLGSKHPTVKPVDLMQWLVRLVTPKGGLVLDPFAGTGTTAEACYREGMRCMLVERETEYQADIRRRMALCMAGPVERAHQSIKAKRRDRPADHGPLFGGAE